MFKTKFLKLTFTVCGEYGQVGIACSLDKIQFNHPQLFSDLHMLRPWRSGSGSALKASPTSLRRMLITREQKWLDVKYKFGIQIEIGQEGRLPGQQQQRLTLHASFGSPVRRGGRDDESAIVAVQNGKISDWKAALNMRC
jgi:hypothetical protein